MTSLPEDIHKSGDKIVGIAEADIKVIINYGLETINDRQSQVNALVTKISNCINQKEINLN